jgi:hypothetical protein
MSCSVCDPATSDRCTAQGTCACGGILPFPCGAGLRCDAGACECGPGTCAGCCIAGPAGYICSPGNLGNSCGTGGVACMACRGGTQCVAGTCQ